MDIVVTQDEKNGNIATTSCIGNLPGNLGDLFLPWFLSESCAVAASASDVARLGCPVF